MMWYVNNVLCYTAKRRDEIVLFYLSQGQQAEVREVERDKNGGYILSINDPMEQ